MKTGLISVVLPAHNAAATLPRAISSITGQTFPRWELLIIDDGSTDATGTIAGQAASEDERIRLISFPENRGITAALNAGLAGAKGSYIARMDADDQMHPERLALQSAFLDSHPEIGLVSCRVQHGGDKETQKGYALYIDWINRLLTPDDIRRQRFIESPLAHPSVMFREKLVEEFGGYREGHFPEDYELWLRWMNAGVRMAKVPETLLTWHDLPERLSRKNARYSPEAFARCKAFYLAQQLKKEGHDKRPVFLCGAGRITRKRSAWLMDEGIRIAGYIDVDPKKIGKQFNGLPVIGLDELGSRKNCFVISYVGSRGAREDIRRILTGKGFTEESDFILAG